MYRIMIADDEGIVISSVKFLINKEFGDECVIESAKTGRSVIELAEKFRPDIAIMDIHMPGINGIEAMKEIRKNNKNILFIVISAHDIFVYAQEAIHLGVIEYIMKPAKKEQIIGALKKAMDMVDKERDRRSNDLRVMEKLETVVPIIENGLVYNILFQSTFDEDIDNYKNLLDKTYDNCYMLAIVYGDNQDGNHMTNAVGSSVRMQKYYHDLRVIIKEYFDCSIGSIMSNKIAVLVSCDKSTLEYNDRIEIINRARELGKYLKKSIDASFRIGIGSLGKIKDMPKSYAEALNALVLTTGSVAHADDVAMRSSSDQDYCDDIEKKLLEQIEKGEVDSVVNSAQTLFNSLVETSNIGLDNVRLKVLEIVLCAERIMRDKCGTEHYMAEQQDYLSTIVGTSDYDMLKHWFVDKIKSCCSNIRGSQSKKTLGIVECAKKYIEENYSKDISLIDVSKEVNISPYYFSKLFKDETGCNFIDYLTGIRIENAKKLLNTSEYSMKEICVMVGYSEPNYFSKSFKKNVGVTPTEYKEGKSCDLSLSSC